MPKPPAHLLLWSAENRLYLLDTSGHPPLSIIPGNEETWRAWLMTHSSFSFQGKHGHLNVLKEFRQRGTGYWYAYHTSSGRNRKRYLGTGAMVTLARLEETAQALQRSEQEPLPPSLHTFSSLPWVPRLSAEKELPFSRGEHESEYTDVSMAMALSRLSP